MRTLLLILLVGCFYSSFAQSKQDYYWPFGKDQIIEESGVQASAFDFNNQPFDPERRNGVLNFDRNNASICDADGNLLFYTNGCAVSNRNHELMPNGEGINAGPFFEEIWEGDCRNGYPGRQDIIILPDPGYEDGYYIIHKPQEWDGTDASTELLRFSYVDMNLDGGLGDVTIKNEVFHSGADPLWSYLTAAKHENQQDWWLINPIDTSNSFLRYLITDNGIEPHDVQRIGPVNHWNASAAGDSEFSPDGTKYAYFNVMDGLWLVDFDRTSGLLSNLRTIPPLDTDNLVFASVEWSPNSELLYLTTTDTVWQVDIMEENLEDSKLLIGTRTSMPDPFSSSFFISALGPDCRIYIRTGSGTNSFHVINKPNERGIACDFVQQGIRLPLISARGSFPNFPRFRVDEEEKCDPSISTFVGETVYWRRDMTVFPNPAIDRITMELPEAYARGEVYVVDMEGQIVMTHDIGPEHTGSGLQTSMLLDVAVLPEGSYSVEFVPEDNSERWCILRFLSRLSS